MSTNNPLSSYFRSPKLYVTLPTQARFYAENVVEMPENGELPIFSMTAKDELIMKNPDALLNGEAVAEVIKSCVPAVKDPTKLVNNDVEKLLIAVQAATNNNEIHIVTQCPECEHEDEFDIDAQALLETSQTILESEYIESINGLEFALRPYSYANTVKSGLVAFRATRSMQALQDITDELDQLKAFTRNYESISKLSFELMLDSIQGVRGANSDGEEFVVTDKKNIGEFLSQAEGTTVKKLDKKLSEINSIGVNKTTNITCSECSHAYTKELEFDPVNFSIPS